MPELSGNEYIFQQDGVRCHTSAYSLDFLHERVPVLQQKIRSMDQLKSEIVKAWDEFPQDSINRSIDGFRMRLRLVKVAEGGLIERYL